MEPGDIIIDGGNSYYHDAVDQAAKLAAEGPATMSMSAPAAASGAWTAATA